jgi:hypothetical protein
MKTSTQEQHAVHRGAAGQIAENRGARVGGAPARQRGNHLVSAFGVLATALTLYGSVGVAGCSSSSGAGGSGSNRCSEGPGKCAGGDSSSCRCGSTCLRACDTCDYACTFTCTSDADCEGLFASNGTTPLTCSSPSIVATYEACD